MVSRTKKVKQPVQKPSQSNAVNDDKGKRGLPPKNLWQKAKILPSLLPQIQQRQQQPAVSAPPPPVPVPVAAPAPAPVEKTKRPRTEYFDFKVYREDEDDVYKINAPSALVKLLESRTQEDARQSQVSYVLHGQGVGVFTQDDLELMQFIGRDLDRSMSFEEILTAPPSATQVHNTNKSKPKSKDTHKTKAPQKRQPPNKWPDMSDEILEQIRRLPSWLQSMVLYKYPAIHSHYQENTLKFFRAMANRIDKRYGKLRLTPGNTSSMEAEDPLAIAREGGLNYFREHEDDLVIQNDGRLDDKLQFRKTSNYTDSALALRLAHAAGLWRTKAVIPDLSGPNKNSKNEEWTPQYVSKANFKLRSALQTRARQEDIETVLKDEEMLSANRNNKNNKHDNAGSESEEDEAETLLYRTNQQKKYWNDIFDANEVRKTAEKRVDHDLMPHRQHDHRLGQKRTKDAEKRKKMKLKENLKKQKRLLEDKWRQRKRTKHHMIFVTKKGKRRNKRRLLIRGYFRDHSRLFRNHCSSTRKTPQRLTRKYRWDDSFHKYCVALVSSYWFNLAVMILIMLNAFCLALETDNLSAYTQEDEDDVILGERHLFVFDVIDNVFVSIYTAEFLVKIYAFPYRYWKSGLNIFDFTILFLSLIKNILDWTDIWDSNIIRFFLIVRAMRILRGISLSVQLQVLLTAVIETIRSHVLSVVLLLILCLYVTSLIAFYLFGESYPVAFGNVGRGMLNMIRVLTIDGWTDLDEGLTEEVPVKGTIFLIICIVLGNFLFSNIFVAIIILNISEATDRFRDTQKEQRETVVRLKKEKVFQRQKLDLRQLFSKQETSAYTDFFSVGENFQKLLRHDDLVATKDVICSPLWLDCLYHTSQKANHTSSVLMNLHREMADNLLELQRHYKESHYQQIAIRRARYNRYLRMKAKLELIKQKIFEERVIDRPKPRIKLPE